MGVFLFVKLDSALWLAILLVLFFAGGSLLIVVMSIRRMPSWHRARKVAREYIQENGGDMPRELRTWN